MNKFSYSFSSILFILLFPFQFFAQVNPFSNVYDIGCKEAVPAYSNGYLIVGSRALFQIDVDGNIVWQRNILTPNDFEIYCVTRTFDSCYVCAGSIYDTTLHRHVICCFKINQIGDTLWCREVDAGSVSQTAYYISETFDHG